jgi:hypothetical protein
MMGEASQDVLRWGMSRGTHVDARVHSATDEWGGIGLFASEDIPEGTVVLRSTHGQSPMIMQVGVDASQAGLSASHFGISAGLRQRHAHRRAPERRSRTPKSTRPSTPTGRVPRPSAAARYVGRHAHAIYEGLSHPAVTVWAADEEQRGSFIRIALAIMYLRFLHATADAEADVEDWAPWLADLERVPLDLPQLWNEEQLRRDPIFTNIHICPFRTELGWQLAGGDHVRARVSAPAASGAGRA